MGERRRRRKLNLLFRLLQLTLVLALPLHFSQASAGCDRLPQAVLDATRAALLSSTDRLWGPRSEFGVAGLGGIFLITLWGASDLQFAAALLAPLAARALTAGELKTELAAAALYGLPAAAVGRPRRLAKNALGLPNPAEPTLPAAPAGAAPSSPPTRDQLVDRVVARLSGRLPRIDSEWIEKQLAPGAAAAARRQQPDAAPTPAVYLTPPAAVVDGPRSFIGARKITVTTYDQPGFLQSLRRLPGVDPGDFMPLSPQHAGTPKTTAVGDGTAAAVAPGGSAVAPGGSAVAPGGSAVAGAAGAVVRVLFASAAALGASVRAVSASPFALYTTAVAALLKGVLSLMVARYAVFPLPPSRRLRRLLTTASVRGRHSWR